MKHKKDIANSLQKQVLRSAGGLYRSVWFFPFVLLCLLVTLTTLQISGTSIGIYESRLYGKEHHDTDLIYGTPQPIRSDEWLGWTQNTTTQFRSGFPDFNKKIGNDGDFTKNSEVPTRDWIALLRPHNLAFFILPFENAFAFKWWFILFSLMVAAYFFVLRFLPNRRLVATLLAISFSVSPFLMWWYQSPLFIAMTAGFCSIIIGMRIIDDSRLRLLRNGLSSHIAHTLMLAYVFSVTGLTLYPPYSLSVLLVAAIFLMGYLLHRLFEESDKRALLTRSASFIAAVIITVCVGAAYFIQHKPMVEATANSLYPGSRRVDSGSLPLFATLDGFLMPLLQGQTKGLSYYTNQSEASNFIIALPVMVIVLFIVTAYDWRKTGKPDLLLIALLSFSLLLLLRVHVRFDIPVYHLLLFDRIPNERLRSGLGFLAFISMIVIIAKLAGSYRTETRLRMPLIVLIATLIPSLLVATFVYRNYPLFAGSIFLVYGLAIGYSLVVASVFSRWLMLGAIMLLVFTVGSTFKVMPLYRGLDPVLESRLLQRIESVSPPSSKWITTDDLYYLNYPAMAGRYGISGSQNYPDTTMWEKVAGKQYEHVYNRQARAIFVTDPTMKEKMRLIAPNYFQIKLECSSFIRHRVDYVLAVQPVSESCFKLETSVKYPRQEFFIYSIH